MMGYDGFRDEFKAMEEKRKFVFMQAALDPVTVERKKRIEADDLKLQGALEQ